MAASLSENCCLFTPLAKRMIELTSDKAEINKRGSGGENGPSSRSVYGRNLTLVISPSR